MSSPLPADLHRHRHARSTALRDPDTAFHGMRRAALAGATIVVCFFGVLGAWAALAPLESAAIAPGELSVENNRKTIQHLEGGIVAEILVRDGEQVKAGQALVRLDGTQARAMLEQLRLRHGAALALAARLRAERDGLEAVDFPAVLLDAVPASKAAEGVIGERNIFAARRRALDGQAAILAQRIAQFENEIVGLKGQVGAETRQLQLIAEELFGQEKLLERRLAGTQRRIELQRQSAEVEGSRSRRVAEIARVKQNIAEVRLKILELTTNRVNEAVAELRTTQRLVFDLDERIRAAADVLARTRIDSPLDGIIVDLRLHTVGGVIAPGEALMDIVPLHERLIVRAQVKPEDIDTVHPGLGAQVILTAFNRRNVPPLAGVVRSVSADRLTDRRSGAPYFLARIALPEQPYARRPDLHLYPGMQAEVMIVTGEHTPLEYLIRPLVTSFDRALREE